MVPVLASQTVGVIGSGTDAHADLAEPLGRLLATLGVNLLTGGGGGAMEAVSRAFVGARPSRGISIGVLPCSPDDAASLPPGYANPYVQLRILTHLPDRGREGHLPSSRNHVNVLTSHAIVALPGSHGTASEIRLALRYRRPIVAYCRSQISVDEVAAAVPRLTTLAEVEAFLRSELNIE